MSTTVNILIRDRIVSVLATITNKNGFEHTIVESTKGRFVGPYERRATPFVHTFMDGVVNDDDLPGNITPGVVQLATQLFVKDAVDPESIADCLVNDMANEVCNDSGIEQYAWNIRVKEYRYGYLESEDYATVIIKWEAQTMTPFGQPAG